MLSGAQVSEMSESVFTQMGPYLVVPLIKGVFGIRVFICNMIDNKLILFV